MKRIANKAGLLKCARTKGTPGHVSEALVNKTKAGTRLGPGTHLLEASGELAVADDFVEWLLSQKGTISKHLDLEF